MTTVFEGGCLCGEARFSISAEPVLSGRCYCAACQKLSGAGCTENIAFAEQAYAVQGPVADYVWTADSGGTVTTSFCGQCGSPLFGKSTSMPGLKMVRVGALDDPGVYEPRMAVFAKSRLPWAPRDERFPEFQEMPPTPDAHAL